MSFRFYYGGIFSPPIEQQRFYLLPSFLAIRTLSVFFAENGYYAGSDPPTMLPKQPCNILIVFCKHHPPQDGEKCTPSSLQAPLCWSTQMVNQFVVGTSRAGSGGRRLAPSLWLDLAAASQRFVWVSVHSD